jgi:hypothetical protein
LWQTDLIPFLGVVNLLGSLVKVRQSFRTLSFDQTWDLAHQQGVILQVTFEGTHMVGYELIPTHVDGDGTVHIAGAEEAAQVLDRIQQASDHLK